MAHPDHYAIILVPADLEPEVERFVYELERKQAGSNKSTDARK